MDLPLQYAVIYDGSVFTFSRPSNILSLINPMKNTSHSWLSVIERLVNRSPSFGIGTLIWFLVTCGNIWYTRQWQISCYAVRVQGGGSIASIFSVNPPCGAGPGILLIRGRRWGMKSSDLVKDFIFQDYCRIGCVNTDWKVRLR